MKIVEFFTWVFQGDTILFHQAVDFGLFFFLIVLIANLIVEIYHRWNRYYTKYNYNKMILSEKLLYTNILHFNHRH